MNVVDVYAFTNNLNMQIIYGSSSNTYEVSNIKYLVAVFKARNKSLLLVGIRFVFNTIRKNINLH